MWTEIIKLGFYLVLSFVKDMSDGNAERKAMRKKYAKKAIKAAKSWDRTELHRSLERLR